MTKLSFSTCMLQPSSKIKIFDATFDGGFHVVKCRFKFLKFVKKTRPGITRFWLANTRRATHDWITQLHCAKIKHLSFKRCLALPGRCRHLVAGVWEGNVGVLRLADRLQVRFGGAEGGEDTGYVQPGLYPDVFHNSDLASSLWFCDLYRSFPWLAFPHHWFKYREARSI